MMLAAPDFHHSIAARACEQPSVAGVGHLRYQREVPPQLSQFQLMSHVPNPHDPVRTEKGQLVPLWRKGSVVGGSWQRQQELACVPTEHARLPHVPGGAKKRSVPAENC